MYKILLVCILGILGTTMGGSRYTRDTWQCRKAEAEYDSCTHQAYENYKRAYFKGNDGEKPDWLARKACNFLTESVQICANVMTGVCSGQKIQQKKTELLTGVLN